MVTVKPTLGIFGAIFNERGCLLVKQREKEDRTYIGEWDLPGGGIESAATESALDERVFGEEFLRELREELGMMIEKPLWRMPSLYPALSKGGKDLAFVMIVGVVDSRPTRGKWRYVSPDELEDLAFGLEGDRLLSGYGKRMHRLCLRTLASRDCPNPRYRVQAEKMLKKIQEES
ncbi:MAG: NUDIX domain-containing protein [Candidatus Paceibacterota bacterium]|jgi:8-oxo-dGTP pyrophosphatase MutT (NUDIX family)